MTATTDLIPLISHRRPGAVIAWREGRSITVAEFLRDVEALAVLLPASEFLLNLCQDRYRFFVAFAAALVRSQTNLLPPNHTERMLAQIRERYPRLSCVAEAGVSLADLAYVVYPESFDLPVREREVPRIAASHDAALVFTSGSTGAPKANLKTWGKLVSSAKAEAEALGLTHLAGGAPFNVLGTVPPQHMYGLESSVLLPLHAAGAMHTCRPLFARDVQAQLEELPAPRVLITTPIHIRACLEDQVRLPALELIVSAAAPLPKEMAIAAETRFSTRLLEVYGFTEAGMVATRRTAETEVWRTMRDIVIEQSESGWTFRGGHVHGSVAASDLISSRRMDEFVLEGRAQDIVNIAGKRASLADLNHKLLEVPGVQDGAFHLPVAADDRVARLMAFVVAPTLSEEQIVAALRRAIDPVFLPRPLIKVQALPRAPTGKLPLDNLRALEAQADAAQSGKERDGSSTC